MGGRWHNLEPGELPGDQPWPSAWTLCPGSSLSPRDPDTSATGVAGARRALITCQALLSQVRKASTW